MILSSIDFQLFFALLKNWMLWLNAEVDFLTILARKFKLLFFVSLELQGRWTFRKYVSFSMNGTIKKKKIIVNGYDSCKTKDQRSMKLIGLNWTMKWHIERNWSVKRRKMHPIPFIGKMSKKKYLDKNTSTLGNYNYQANI